MRARDLLLTGLAAIMAYASPVPARQAPTLAPRWLAHAL